MLQKRTVKYFPFFVIFITYLSCSTTSLVNNPQKQKQRVNELVNRILRNREDIDALQELGIILVKTRRYDRGRILLERAYKMKTDDPKTLFYYALSLEFCGKEQEAFSIYRRYEETAYQSHYRLLMKNRYNSLNRKRMKDYARQLLAQERLLDTQQLSPKSVVVFPFVYHGDNEEYATLSKGLCEMMITDLSQVKDLQLIERVRLNALLDEMKLGQTGLLDPNTTAKTGRLLTAGQIVFGAYDVRGEDKLHVALEHRDLLDRNKPPARAGASGTLDQLLTLEKRMVFGVIKKMGIEMTQEERERILRVPTRNIQAFITYCKGLEQQDGGQFQAAAASFQQAARMDPTFDVAGEKLMESQALTQADDMETLLVAADDPQSMSSSTQTQDQAAARDLQRMRMQNISDSMNTNLMPGQDNRKTAVEAAAAQADVGLGVLPDPPRPPGSQNP